jgi:hypothetical protein
MQQYVIQMGRGLYLSSRPGWGPTFSQELSDARLFDSVSAAYEYRRNNLGTMNCKIARLGPVWNPTPTPIC